MYSHFSRFSRSSGNPGRWGFGVVEFDRLGSLAHEIMTINCILN